MRLRIAIRSLSCMLQHNPRAMQAFCKLALTTAADDIVAALERSDCDESLGQQQSGIAVLSDQEARVVPKERVHAAAGGAAAVALLPLDDPACWLPAHAAFSAADGLVTDLHASKVQQHAGCAIVPDAALSPKESAPSHAADTRLLSSLNPVKLTVVPGQARWLRCGHGWP